MVRTNYCRQCRQSGIDQWRAAARARDVPSRVPLLASRWGKETPVPRSVDDERGGDAGESV